MNRRNQKENRRWLRRKATPSERELWKLLKELRKEGITFHRQHGIGCYVVDFYCPALRLVIELDGQVHIGNEEYDRYRDDYIQRTANVHILRYENKFVFEHPDCILKDIEDIRNSHL